MDPVLIWLCAAFFATAFIYSMAGMGGGSLYLAFLVLAGLPYDRIAPLALLCNVVVSACAFYHFSLAGHFDFKKTLPFVVLSIPLAYLGGRIHLGKEWFSMLLGLSLLAASLRIFLGKFFEDCREVSSWHLWQAGLPAGGILGFLSGLVGIGGGIFLSPLLLLMRWMDVKRASASASFFILVNSLSGLAGQLQKGGIETRFFLPLSLAVFLGGQMGAVVGSRHLPRPLLGRMLGGLVFYVSMKLLWGIR